MPVVSGKEVVRHAYENGYAVAAINCQGGNYDLLRAVVEAAAEEKAPVIVAVHPNNTGYYGLEWAPEAVRILIRDMGIPVAVHLDHGQDIPTVIRAARSGYSSVMIDYSARSLQENIEATCRILDEARPHGVSVEAELGELLRNAGDTETTPSAADNLVDPTHVSHFLSKAPVDMLAVGIGNAHGFYKGTPNIRLDLLTRVREVACETPLVLHGTTGIPEDIVRKCVELGMAKVNFGTQLRVAYLNYLNEALQGEFDHSGHAWRLLEHVKERLKTDIRKIIRLTGGSGRA